MVDSQKKVFWKAAVLTLIIFLLGVLLGYYLEKERISEIEEQYKNVEIEWADAKLQTLYYQLMSPLFCESAIKENLEFADRSYKEGLKLEEYEESNKIMSKMFYEKKRYVLLKLEFWINSILLQEKCNAKYTNLVYFYKNEPNINEKSEQETQSRILNNLKTKYGPQLMLIPLPLDMNLTMVNVFRDTYNITSVPSILINEKIKLEGIHDIEELEKMI